MRRIARLETSLDISVIVFIVLLWLSSGEAANKLLLASAVVFTLDVLITCVHGALEVYKETH